jgi:hypothetical protein
MGYTLQEMRDFVRTYLDVEEDELPDSVIDKAARDGSRRIWRKERRWPFAEGIYAISTIPGQADYDLSAFGVDIDQIVDVRGPTWELKWISPHSADLSWTPSTTSTGSPTHFSRWGSVVTFWPTPDAIYVRGFRGPTDWVAVDGEPDLPDEFHELILTWVLRGALLQQDDPEMAQVHEATFDNELEQLRRNYKGAPLSGPLVLNQPSVTQDSALLDRLRFPFET